MADDDDPKVPVPANLLAFGKGAPRLPKNYVHAVAAVRECARIDEAKAWADKMEALRCYAVQRDDPALRSYALKIKLRAYRRMGQIFDEIQEGHRARDKRGDGSSPPLTRTQAANAAGLTRWERRAALRLAHVDDADFTAAVDENDDPPSLARLAKMAGSAATAPKSQRRAQKKSEAPKPPFEIESLDELMAALPVVGSAARGVAWEDIEALPRPALEANIETINATILALQQRRQRHEEVIERINATVRELQELRAALEDAPASDSTQGKREEEADQPDAVEEPAKEPVAEPAKEPAEVEP
jgi:hypothetical protein